MSIRGQQPEVLSRLRSPRQPNLALVSEIEDVSFRYALDREDVMNQEGSMEVPIPKVGTAPTFREQVLSHLRERIMSGELPPGALVTPAKVAKQLNTSAMPVREALRTLELEGLVEVSGRRHTRIATPSRAVADEAYPLLGLLEAYAIRRGTGLTETAFAEAEGANATLSRTSSTADRTRAMFGFHRAVCAAAGPITHATLEMLYGRVGLLESVYARGIAPDTAIAEHREIMVALRSGDVEKAARLNEDHWRSGYAAILPFLTEVQS